MGLDNISLRYEDKNLKKIIMDIFEGTPKISNTFKPCKYGQWKGHKECPY